jgi:hypothetical protein
MNRPYIIDQYSARHADVIYEIIKRGTTPTLETEQEQHERFTRYALYEHEAGYCIDAPHPAQGSHENHGNSTFTHAYREL